LVQKDNGRILRRHDADLKGIPNTFSVRWILVAPQPVLLCRSWLQASQQSEMSISSDEVNYLIYRYLQENGDYLPFSPLSSHNSIGFTHSAFSFAHESLVVKSTVAYTDLPPGALITFLQKGLEYVGIEEHINEVGSSLMRPVLTNLT
jgi:hypothetical protein